MAKSERSGKIQTVLGLIEPEQLEVTITHITAGHEVGFRQLPIGDEQGGTR